MKPSPAFSVVIPTRNRPRQLANCLRALSRLDYPFEKFEVIVVDDGGRADLEAVVSLWRGRLDISLLRQAQSGPGRARNRGAEHARGKYLAFTDDDCAPAPAWLQAMEAQLESHPDSIVGGRTVNALPRNLFSSTSQMIMDYVYAYYNPDPLSARFFATNNFTVPRALFREAGGFDAGWTLAAAEDRELCDRWIALGRGLVYAPEAVVFHAHRLNLRSFCRQHFTYGRGAYRFHQARAGRGAGSFRPDLGFYARSFLAPWAQPRLQPRAYLILCIALWHAANLAGYLWEKQSARK